MARVAKEKTKLRKRFDVVAYGAVNEYAARNDLSQAMLSNILGGKTTGKQGGATSIEIFECLKRDGIYEDEFFPWQKEYKALESQSDKEKTAQKSA